MASIHKEITIHALPAEVWDAVRDVGAIHTRLAKGFVTDTKLEDGARVVTFANGMVARELLVDLDEQRRRLAWSVVGTQMTHHNASLQLFPTDDGGTRALWIADLLPHAIAPQIAGLIEQGLAAMKRTLEAATARHAA